MRAHGPVGARADEHLPAAALTLESAHSKEVLRPEGIPVWPENLDRQVRQRGDRVLVPKARGAEPAGKTVRLCPTHLLVHVPRGSSRMLGAQTWRVETRAGSGVACPLTGGADTLARVQGPAQVMLRL